MDRLTKPAVNKTGSKYVSAIGSGRGAWPAIIHRLAAYENTGLEPEQIQPQLKWINVNERLPEEDGTYLVYTERGSVYASHFYTRKYFGSGYTREAQWSQRGTVKVTHWMPLPKPPRGE